MCHRQKRDSERQDHDNHQKISLHVSNNWRTKFQQVKIKIISSSAGDSPRGTPSPLPIDFPQIPLGGKFYHPVPECPEVRCEAYKRSRFLRSEPKNPTGVLFDQRFTVQIQRTIDIPSPSRFTVEAAEKKYGLTRLGCAEQQSREVGDLLAEIHTDYVLVHGTQAFFQ